MSRHHESDRPCWAEALPIRVEPVLQLWRTSVATIDPWANMELDDVTGELRAIASALVNAACDDTDTRQRSFAAAAYEHGQFRRAQGFPRRLLAVELMSLRETIRVELEMHDWSGVLIDQTIGGLVVDLRLARQCAERGYDDRPRAAPVVETETQRTEC